MRFGERIVEEDIVFGGVGDANDAVAGTKQVDNLGFERVVKVRELEVVAVDVEVGVLRRGVF